MRKLLLPAAAAALCACSGAAVQLKAQDQKIAELRSLNDALAVQLKDRGAELDAAKSAKSDVDGKLSESAEKLAIANGRIESLEKSNAELSSAAGASQTELGGKLGAAVAEKDALGAKLAEEQKEKLGAVRLKGIYKSARDKAVADREKLSAELEKTRKERDEAAAALAAIDKEKEREATAAEEAKARLHDELGPIADAILKEMQAGTAFAGASSGTITVKLSDSLLFDGDSAKLTDEGGVLLSRVGLALKGLGPRELRVEAHNDDAPLKRGLLGGFEDHWELSSAQAAAATRALAARAGLDPARMTAAGAGAFHAFRSDEDGCANNRCLVISAESARTP